MPFPFEFIQSLFDFYVGLRYISLISTMPACVEFFHYSTCRNSPDHRPKARRRRAQGLRFGMDLDITSLKWYILFHVDFVGSPHWQHAPWTCSQSGVANMAEDNSDDQLDDFIHSYSYSDYDAQTHRSFDDDDVSCTDGSGSETPEDLSAEAEDMDLYELYNNSACTSPQPPVSPAPKNAELEPHSEPEGSKTLHPEWRQCGRGQAPTTFKSCKANPDVVVEDSESDIETSEEDKSTDGEQPFARGHG
ncbi:hypothetical protein C8F04DRAFT_1158608 [Mycena alexandri]|uniref:Uncharacterized protein n=1 Tax=Mycena alexandri TaxID=1745969 RepID=A0AAD6WLI0_9AGAR|nr:hypothetical protein C8F04DRAFT_1158608 [Mycena alexandri]